MEVAATVLAAAASVRTAGSGSSASTPGHVT